jgi:hypothetical protein
MANAQRSNRSVAGVVLGIMAMMAVIGLFFAWITVEKRRQRDLRVSKLEPERVVATAPAKLAGLGYLPGDTNVIAGVHIAELMENTESREILLQARGRSADLGIGQIERWTGLKLEDLHHVVLGFNVDVGDRILPRWTLVVYTRKAYDASRLRQTLKVSERVKRNRRTLYRFNLNQSPFSGMVWLAAERVFVVSMLEEDFEGVPLTPLPGIERFGASLAGFFNGPLHEGTQAWAIGHVTGWQGMLFLWSVMGLKDEERDLLSKIHSFGTWLQMGTEVTWDLTASASDPAAIKEFEHYLAGKGAEPGKQLKLFDRRQEVEPLIQELSRTLTRDQKENTLSFQAKAKAATILRAIQGPNHRPTVRSN